MEFSLLIVRVDGGLDYSNLLGDDTSLGIYIEVF